MSPLLHTAATQVAQSGAEGVGWARSRTSSCADASSISDDAYQTAFGLGCASPNWCAASRPLTSALPGCQLHVEDIRQDEEIWFIDINDRPPRKLKNATAVRRVPIHSELIRLGFLAHVDKHRRIRQQRVFPGLEPGGADARLGHAFTKWFTRYRRDVGVYRIGLDFHSFRHTATTLMHQADVAPAVIDHVTGHATPGETARYTKRSSLVQLQEAIEAIAIGIELPSPSPMP